MTARDLLWLLTGTALGLAVGGWLGLFAGAVLAAGIIWQPTGVIAAAVLAPVAVAIVTLVEAGTDASATRLFPTLRPVAHQLGLVCALAWVAAGAVMWNDAGRREPERRLDASARRGVGSLVILVSVAIAGTLVAID